MHHTMTFAYSRVWKPFFWSTKRWLKKSWHKKMWANFGTWAKTSLVWHFFQIMSEVKKRKSKSQLWKSQKCKWMWEESILNQWHHSRVLLYQILWQNDHGTFSRCSESIQHHFYLKILRHGLSAFLMSLHGCCQSHKRLCRTCSEASYRF